MTVYRTCTRDWSTPSPAAAPAVLAEPAVPLPSTGWLADELFLIAHDDVTGALRVPARTIRRGLAAAMLADLALVGAVTVAATGMVVTGTAAPGAVDPWGRTVLRWIDTDPPHPPAAWIDRLAGHAYRTVADRLTIAGVVRPRTVRRWWWRRDTAYPPVDTNAAAWPWARLTMRVRRRTRLSAHDSTLTRLCLATGLDGHILGVDTLTARRQLRQLLTPVPPGIDELVRHLAAADGQSRHSQHDRRSRHDRQGRR
ncbi:GPP34 family phosphoprotein [Solwaraspora sp. WMMD792]|uniref:GOLPH3/VPS74 family protein n=1 Tax=Solwaraspora sp. WMMD792 TaxID=3016099 RepID=UPI0024163DD6|nr:GPP34 family phosphoprotein [Solwaraspora sp. WMMD792]MDG4769856.1 GPP34 family phosphoprotein [Solwaraspora sp. WMMD792]